MHSMYIAIRCIRFTLRYGVFIVFVTKVPAILFFPS